MNEIERFYEFTGLVSRAYKHLRRAQEKYTREFGLRSTHVAVMLQLHDAADGGMSSAELSRACGVDRAQISRVVAELNADGLIGTPAGEKRRYRGSLILTEKGRELAEKIRGIVLEKFQSVASTLNPDEVASFYRVFNAIDERLETI